MTAPAAIILVGGLGTRLRTLYPDRPKALVPVAGRPFIAWLIDWLHRHGITRIHLAAGYRADQLVTWRNEQPAHQDLTVSIEPEPLGTAECQDVLAVRMPVLPPTRVIIQKLRALDEHNCDFTTVLPAVRAIRETLRWKDIRAETADHDYAAAFLVLADRLSLTGDGEQS